MYDSRLINRESYGKYVSLQGGEIILDNYWFSFKSPDTHITQDQTRHSGFPAVQLRLICDQICTGSESLHVKCGAKEKKRNGNNWEP